MWNMPEAPVEAQLIAMQIRDELYRMATIVHDPRNDAKALISRHIDGVHALMGAIGGGGVPVLSDVMRTDYELMMFDSFSPTMQRVHVALERMLLEVGGEKKVCQPDDDAMATLVFGHLFEGEIEIVEGEPSRCHANSAYIAWPGGRTSRHGLRLYRV